ncbi:hypothetical protein [Paenibacillus soyae]|uniref:Uncharacterized protein n=1 Tax=Paenibacillus soyae TaxID=2969249 RepID=A0A9X2MNH9_9BACL|nr:hypothetical protein [Paenibacillus soyae]MCR2803339.1 hypothetical protein [Paenibacillus soyae]
MKQILVFVLFAATICWIMFSPIYKHVAIVRQAVLQQEVDYLLEVGASGTYGYISTAMEEESRRRLAGFGLREDAVEYRYETTSGADATDPMAPVIRGVGIELTVTYPFENLFLIDSLIGVTPVGPDERMSAYGMKMSEYVP